jgi:hypothetical protein
MPKLGIEFDEEAQKKLEVPLGKRELYPSVGKYVAEILREQGVSIAFGVPGGHIWHFVDAISRIGIKLIIFGHESQAVYAAEGYTQVTQKAAVSFGTVSGRWNRTRTRSLVQYHPGEYCRRVLSTCHQMGPALFLSLVCETIHDPRISCRQDGTHGAGGLRIGY